MDNPDYTPYRLHALQSFAILWSVWLGFFRPNASRKDRGMYFGALLVMVAVVGSLIYGAFSENPWIFVATSAITYLAGALFFAFLNYRNERWGKLPKY